MRVVLVSPAPANSPMGNAVTSERWRAVLRELGHEASVQQEWSGQDCDLLVALHACKSGPSIERYQAARPDGLLIVGLAGTDLYRDLLNDGEAMERLRKVDALIGLHGFAARALPSELQSRVHVIYQSVTLPDLDVEGDRMSGRVCVLANLRSVKDPLLAAKASLLLPPESALRVRHAGQSLDAQLAEEARELSQRSERYEFLGPLPRAEALALLAQSRALVLSSKLEGGANVVGEAIMLGLPVLSTDIEGSRGLLGEDHPGFFPVGDERALAELLRRTETDVSFLAELRDRSVARQPLFEPAREREAWRSLLAEVSKH